MVTERALARLCDISQPHMHNVLKNIRSLSIKSADRLMLALEIRVSDLLWLGSGEDDVSVRTVPVVRNRIGPGTDSILTVFRGYLPLPQSLLRNLIRPVAARLAPDLVLPRAVAARDLVLLDQNPAVRAMSGSASASDSIWIVDGGAGLRVRYLRVGGTLLYIAHEDNLSDPRRWKATPLRGRNILDIVRARIVWIGREMETEQARPADQAGQGD
jgi:hypothetical protein